MKAKQLILENFRNARNLEFSGELQFDEHVNVFYGINGAGKSTVLDAMTILLSWFVSRLKSPTASGRPIRENDILNDCESASLKLTVSHESGEFCWRLVKNRIGRHPRAEKSDYTRLNDLAGYLTELDPPVYPVLAFYPVTRAVFGIGFRSRVKHTGAGPLEAYDNALSSASDFHTFFEWFRAREDLENESFRHDNPPRKDAQLEAVRLALSRFLPGFSSLTVRRDPLRMEIRKDDKVLIVDQLSDGEKCLLALIGDLARRLAAANAEHDIDPLLGEGIVLIDEIDLHLHPAWQRMVTPRLRQVFPNCQFFISTHSPLVLSQLRPQNLFLLRCVDGNLTAERPSESYGKNSTRILEDLMGLETTTADEVAESLKNIFRLIAENNFHAARAAIAALRDSGFNDPELKQAETLIRRRELIGK